jgi:hypothetical protein
MGEFSKSFERFVASESADPLETSPQAGGEGPEAEGASGRASGGRSQRGMNADSLSRILKTAEGSVVAAGSEEVVLTKLARELVHDPEDGVRTLRRWGRRAKKEPYEAMGALATFGEVLKRALAMLRQAPSTLGAIIEAFHKAAAKVAKALGARSFTLTLDLPHTVALAYSWKT